MPDPKRSPLNAVHTDAGGRFVTFAGWRLPVHYGSILEEARSVRSKAGMFDVSHMGRVRVRGSDALATFERLGTNDLRKIAPGKAQYTVWCTPDGGTIDDLIVFWLADEEFLVVFNASSSEDDLQHLEEHSTGDVTILDETEGSAMIAAQGPDALGIASGLGLEEKLPRFGVARSTIAGVGVVASRTGYTGEDGIEIVCEAGAGPRVWEALRESGVVPCGLGARDALRMEMGYPLYGHELGLDTTPLEAGLGFAVSIDDREFVGRDALAKQIADGVPRRLVGFVCSKPSVPQQGDEVGPGVVTSGGTSVVLNAPIGLAFVPAGASLGPVTLRTRGKEIPCDLRALPLIERKRPKKKES